MPAEMLLLQHTLYFSSKVIHSALFQNKSQQSMALGLATHFSK